MLSTDTCDLESSIRQMTELASAGCELVRVAVVSTKALPAVSGLVQAGILPVIADIHFNYRLALGAIEAGVAKLRINPGTIGDFEQTDAVCAAAARAGIPVRIGVNAGSLAAEIAARDDLSLAEKLVQSSLSFVQHFEERGFSDLVLSVKASSVPVTIAAYRALAQRCDYPLHIGVTEAGTAWAGTIKSAVGLGTLLADGIGDTLRVSLTADPVEEVRAAWEILAALDLRRRRPEMISCPTCGRCEVDLIPLAREIEARLDALAHDDPRYRSLKIAVMGCVVNGPGEAREADFGIAAGRTSGMIFARGKPLHTVPENELVDALFSAICHQGRTQIQGSG
jgi:(E)-4-hydroxy-3-methylbut-2-enyl-diphosphate synthase